MQSLFPCMQPTSVRLRSRSKMKCSIQGRVWLWLVLCDAFSISGIKFRAQR